MMIQTDYQQLQSNLPRLLVQVESGDTVVICKDEKPVAEIRPLGKRRPVGLAKGRVTIHPSFHDSLPEEILNWFEGKPE